MIFLFCFMVKYYSHSTRLQWNTSSYQEKSLKFLTYIAYCILFAILTWFSLFVGWVTYMSIGRDDTRLRVGMFDFFIGYYDKNHSISQQHSLLLSSTPTTSSFLSNSNNNKNDNNNSYSDVLVWSFMRLWFRDFSGMSLRGLVWTVPTGLLLLLADDSFEGWEYLLSGGCMGLIYEISWDIPIDAQIFSRGTELGEFITGFFLTFVLITSILGHYPGSFSSLNFLNQPITIIISILSSSLFLGSAITFSLITQSDEINRDQSLIGIIVPTIWILLISLPYALNFVLRVLNMVPTEKYAKDEILDENSNMLPINENYDDKIRAKGDYHWRMFSLFSIILKVLFLMVFVTIFGTSLTSCVWYYAYNSFN